MVLHGSAFLQKPTAPQQFLQMTHEEINSFMSVMCGMNWSQPLTLVCMLPAGSRTRPKRSLRASEASFPTYEVIVPKPPPGILTMLQPTRVMDGASTVTRLADRVW